MADADLSNMGAAENQVMDFVNRLDRLREGRIAVHLHLSQLKAYNRRDHHLRIAMHAFEPMIQGHGATLFRMSNDDLIFVSPGVSMQQVEEVVQKLRYLFSADPLVSGAEREVGAFATYYDLKKDYPDFRAVAERLLAAVNRRRELAQQDGPAPKPKEALTPQRLMQLEQAVNNMNLEPLLRHQPVCAIAGDSPPQPVFNEYFISIGELADKLMPDVDLTADRWLFQRLTSNLDKRVLTLLPDTALKTEEAVSINANVSTLLSNEFLEFDGKFRTVTKRPIVLELQAHDIFSDMGAFAFARDFCHDRGYRLALDGLNHLTFPLLHRDQLKMDFVKITWSPDLIDEAQGQRRVEFEREVKRAGASRVILCRCDDQRAIGFGKSLGISLFQGRHLEQNLDANKVVETESRRRYRQEHSIYAAERKAKAEELARKREESTKGDVTADIIPGPKMPL